MTQDQKLLVDAEIKELLKKGDVMEATLVRGQFASTISTIFRRLKKEKTFWSIKNLRYLNQFLPYQEFKIKGLKQLKQASGLQRY